MLAVLVLCIWHSTTNARGKTPYVYMLIGSHKRNKPSSAGWLPNCFRLVTGMLMLFLAYCVSRVAGFQGEFACWKGVTSLVVAWHPHKVRFGSDGEIDLGRAGASQRAGYRVIADDAVPGAGAPAGWANVAHIRHTPNWRRNTYHPSSNIPPSTRGFVCCSITGIMAPLHAAVAKAWAAMVSNRDFAFYLRTVAIPSSVASSSHGLAHGSAVGSWVLTASADDDNSEAAEAVAAICAQCMLIYLGRSSLEAMRKFSDQCLLDWRPGRHAVHGRNYEV